MTSRFRTQRAICLLALVTCFAVPAHADPIITEFMAANTKTLADNDGDFSDWIELFNPDATAVNLDGWYLTDSATDKKGWKFPAVTLTAGGYLVVFASGKDRKDPAKQLHTNFSLSANGEYLGLVKPDGVTVVTEFAPTFPPQLSDISYGTTQPTVAGEAARIGYLRPTPTKPNGGREALLLLERVTFSRGSGPFTGAMTLTMSGAAAGERIRYVVAPPSLAGAIVAEPTATSTEYTGPITISSTSLVRAAVFSADNVQSGLSTVAQFVHLATTGAARLDTFSSQLPLLVLDTHGTGLLAKDGIDRPAWIYAWDRPAAGDTTLTGAPTVASSLTTHVRGQSSADFPKKSYSLSLNDAAGNSNAVSWFGLDKSDSWELIGPWKYDPICIHNAFIYALSNRIGRWAPRTQLVEVLFDADGGDLDYNDYNGIYVLTDSIKVDSQRVAIKSISPSDDSGNALTGGYLLKIDVTDPTDFSFTTAHGFPGGASSILIAEPVLAAMPKAQRDYIKGYVQGFEDALYANYAAGWQQRSQNDYIDRASWIDYHILNTLTENTDAFARSTYMTKDRNGRLVAGPLWDYDRSMGGGDVRTQRTDVWNGDPGAGATDFWAFGWWAYLARDPEFMQAWIDRWQSLRRNEFASGNLTALVDSLAAQIGPAAGARDAAKWVDDTSRFGTWQGEIDNMKSWLTQHAAWIDAQFTAAPTVSATNGTVTFAPAPGTQLVYTTDGTDPRAFGGAGPSSNSKSSSSPVTLPDTLDVQARSFKASFDPMIVPGSAWSSPVGGPKSSTITPRPRLANLSSRGFVGAGENIMITGVVVADTAGKQYLARAVGPTLASFGVGGALAAPVLTILDANQKTIATNSAWEKGPDASDLPDLATSVGAFPLAKNSKDAALVAKLPYGNYTLQVSSANTATGVALAELYEIESDTGRTLNLSTRGFVQAGEGLLIGGVVVRGPGPKRLLIRAIGPTLGGFGVAGTLADPVLTIFSGQAVVAANDDWGASGATVAANISAAAASVGAFALPSDSKDAALLITLPAGPYTVQVTGKAGAQGVILLEIYEVP